MFWDTIRMDVRYTLRMAVRAPLYTLLAIVALALGIGANTAIFTVVYDVLVRPLPYRSAGELVTVWSNDTNANKPHNPISPADFIDIRDASRQVVTLESYFSFVVTSRLTVDGYSEIVRSIAVTPGLFALVGRDAALGRTLSRDSRDPQIVLSDGFWRRRFGADRSVVGRSVVVDGDPFTIAGVMPADFVFPYKGMLGPTGFVRTLDVDMWMPLSFTDPRMQNESGQLSRAVRFLAAMGRLQRGISVDAARSSIAAIAAALEREHPDTNHGWTTTLVPVHEQVVGDVRPALLLLLSGVAVMLLMACVNVANLVLARAVARRKETAVRAALGAGPWRLARQALTETLLLSLSGAALGLVFVSWGVRALVALAPDNLPRLQEVEPDVVVLVASTVVAVAAGLLIGTVPAITASGDGVQHALGDWSRGTIGSRSRHRMRSALIVAEIALALVLTVGAGLLLRSFTRLLQVDPGFRVDNLLTLAMNLPERLTTADARRAFYATFFERIERLPGVVSVGGTTRIPLGSTNVSTSLQIEGRDVPAGERPTVEFRRAMHGYFQTMGIPVLRGRSFTATDGPTAPPVAIVSESLARHIFGSEDVIGQHVRVGPNPSGPWLTVVGVVGDIRHSRLDVVPDPELYVNSLQNPPTSPFIVIRTSGDPGAMSEQIRAEARALDPTLTLYDIRTMAQIRADSLAEQRFLLLLIGLFGLLALVLASVGVYGVTSVVVSERTQEVGVRLALGAEPSRVLTMILLDAIRLGAIGTALGLTAAAALSPLIASELFGVRTIDPVTFAATPIILLIVAAGAALVPARRAMRMDPLKAINST